MSKKPIPTPPLARAIERDLFGAMLGSLASTLIARFLILAFEMPEILLAVLLMVGAAGGAFAAHYGSRSSETVVVKFRTWNTRLRRISLKVMLCMLVLAGVTGVATVLTASYDTLGRVAGTVIGPWQTIVRLDVGAAVAGPDDGFTVFVTFLKLYK